MEADIQKQAYKILAAGSPVSKEDFQSLINQTLKEFHAVKFSPFVRKQTEVLKWRRGVAIPCVSSRSFITKEIIRWCQERIDRNNRTAKTLVKAVL